MMNVVNVNTAMEWSKKSMCVDYPIWYYLD
jgi:hypothetical protein